MVNYLEVISALMEQPHYLLVILITVYAVAGTIDFVIGSLLVEKGKFSSRVSQLGIIRKIVTLAVLILVIPLAMLLPMDVGVYSLTILYIGVALSEIYSILGHVGLVKDGNKPDTGKLFTDLLDKVFGNKVK